MKSRKTIRKLTLKKWEHSIRPKFCPHKRVMARRASVFVRQSNAVRNKQMWSFLTLVDSTLCGMVALCAGCNIIETYGAFVIGVLAAFVYMGTEKLLHKFLIDDPLGLS